MAENMIKFLRGNVASLPQTATEGAVYFTKDEGLYLGLADGSYHRYGDFITVDDVASLPAAGAHETCMYYCVAENILAKWSGSEWIQINKQKTLAELGGVAKSVYETKMAALEQADTDNSTAISDLETYVGTIPETATATNIVAYVQEKTAGIATDTALEELTGRVATAEGKLTTLTGADTVEGSVAKALKDAKAYTDEKDTAMDARMDAVEGSVTTLTGEESVAGSVKAIAKSYADSKDTAISAAKSAADAAQAAADAAQADVNALEAKVGTVPEDKTVVQMIADAQDSATYDDTAVKASIKAIADDYLKAADKTELSNAIGAEKTRAEGIENGLRTDVDAIKADYLKAADKTELANSIKDVKDDVDAFFASAEVGTAAIDTLKEIQDYIDTHGEAAATLTTKVGDLETTVGKAAEGETPATGLVKAVADNTSAIAAEKSRAEGVEANLAQADADNLAAAKKYADDAITALKIGDYAKQSDLDTHTGDTTVHITADERSKWNAAEGKAHTHSNKALLDTYTQTEENLADAVAKKHSHTNAAELNKIADGDKAKWDAVVADHLVAADKTELEGKISTAQSAAEGKVTELANGAVKANTDAIATINGTGDGSFAKADATLKTNLEAYADQAETDAVATAKAYTESCLTWGEF